ncbi:BTAD domain-containing putative transcriptional regulator [Nonomuraea salmonea]|uniref:BTAD domain-containing putative transcriptional regulator n=1 Tax=Nonomuraea salmonea TaxID=46181 RepID=UPI0031F1A95F
MHLFAARLEAADQARRSGDLPSALRTLDEALVLWRGPALSGVPGLFADGERARLDELHVLAVEARAEVLTGLGRPEDALAALHDLTRRHPLRERPPANCSCWPCTRPAARRRRCRSSRRPGASWPTNWAPTPARACAAPTGSP